MPDPSHSRTSAMRFCAKVSWQSGSAFHDGETSRTALGGKRVCWSLKWKKKKCYLKRNCPKEGLKVFLLQRATELQLKSLSNIWQGTSFISSANLWKLCCRDWEEIEQSRTVLSLSSQSSASIPHSTITYWNHTLPTNWGGGSPPKIKNSTSKTAHYISSLETHGFHLYNLLVSMLIFLSVQPLHSSIKLILCITN